MRRNEVHRPRVARIAHLAGLVRDPQAVEPLMTMLARDEPPLRLKAAAGLGRGAIPFFSNTPPAPALVYWSLGYTALALVLAMFAFRRRDL